MGRGRERERGKGSQGRRKVGQRRKREARKITLDKSEKAQFLQKRGSPKSEREWIS